MGRVHPPHPTIGGLRERREPPAGSGAEPRGPGAKRIRCILNAVRRPLVAKIHKVL